MVGVRVQRRTLFIGVYISNTFPRRNHGIAACLDSSPVEGSFQPLVIPWGTRRFLMCESNALFPSEAKKSHCSDKQTQSEKFLGVDASLLLHADNSLGLLTEVFPETHVATEGCQTIGAHGNRGVQRSPAAAAAAGVRNSKTDAAFEVDEFPAARITAAALLVVVGEGVQAVRPSSGAASLGNAAQPARHCCLPAAAHSLLPLGEDLTIQQLQSLVQ